MYFYVEPGDDAVKKAFQKCGELLKSSEKTETAIVVPQLSNLTGLISNVLGEQAIKLIMKNKKLVLDPEVIHLFTKRRPPRFFSGPLLVAFTPIDQVDKIIRENPQADIVFIPWTPDEKDCFLKQYSPELVE